MVVLFSVWSEGFAIWSRSRDWFKNCLTGENFLKVKWKCHRVGEFKGGTVHRKRVMNIWASLGIRVLQ